MLIVAFPSPLAMDPRSRGGRRQSRRREIGDGVPGGSEAAMTASAVAGVKRSPELSLSVASPRPRPRRRRRLDVPPRVLPPDDAALLQASQPL